MSRLAARERQSALDDDPAFADIEMFVIGEDGRPLPPAEPATRRSIAETLEIWRSALVAVQDNARHLNAAGGVASPQVDFPTLAGLREDVQVPMHADPRAASAAAIEGDLLAHDIAGLRVDPTSLRTHRTELSWEVSLRTSPWRRRPAMLRLSPAPSFQVTVFRLTPVRSQRIATRAFIRAGLRATRELTDRLDDVLRRNAAAH